MISACILATLISVNAATGDDLGDGSERRPYRTLSRAQAAVRLLRQTGALAKDPLTVELTGDFDLAGKGILFSAEDGGCSPQTPIVWRGSASGARLYGSYGLTREDFHAVSDNATRARLKSDVRDRVLVADLTKVGIVSMKPLPVKMPNWSAAGLSLYAGEESLQVARYPNKGWLTITNVIDRGVAPNDPTKDEWEFGVRGGIFEYAGDEPARWNVAKGIWMHGYWCWDWAADSLKIAEIDPVRRTIKSEGIHTYGIGMDCDYQGKRRYYVYNLLEELDTPGEWYVDREELKLYLFPPAGWRGQVRLVDGASPVLTARRTSNLVFENLSLSFAPKGIVLDACTNVVLRQVGVKNVVQDAIAVRFGAECRVEGCRISDVGASGLLMNGGDRLTLTRCNHRATGNRIERCGRSGHSGRCLRFEGCGVIVDHNLFRDAPYCAVSYYGNEHLFEYNEIACAVMEAADGGGMYTGRDWGSLGNVVRYNYFHHFGADGVDWMRAHGEKSGFEPAKGHPMVNGIYLDDCDSGDMVYGNVFEKTGRAILVGGGRWNCISNNLVIGGVSALHLDARGITRAKPGSGMKNGWDLLAKLEEQKYRESPWRERYPHIQNVMEDEPLLPLRNVFVGNISIGAEEFFHWTDKEVVDVIARTDVSGNVQVGKPTARDARLFPSTAAARTEFVEDTELAELATRLTAFELMETEAFKRRFPHFKCFSSDDVGISTMRPTEFARRALEPYAASGELPGAICAYVNGDREEINCIGYADAESKRPISADDYFMQCSQTKGFCGVTVAILVEEGRIALDDPIEKYLPEFKDLWYCAGETNGMRVLKRVTTPPTIRMALNHTAGFNFELPSHLIIGGWHRRMPLRSVAAMAAGIPLAYAPGAEYKYSNVGIDVGAAVVEAVAGVRWEDFLKSRVLDPLGMTAATFKPTDEQLAGRIRLYTTKPGEKAVPLSYHHAMEPPYNDDRVFASAGAGLWMTARDQIKFYKMLMNLGVGENGARILKPETVKNLLAISTRPSGMPGYSLGLDAPVEDSEDAWFGHCGAWRTAGYVNWHKRQLKMIAVQQVGPLDTPWRRAFEKAATAFFGEKK